MSIAIDNHYLKLDVNVPFQYSKFEESAVYQLILELYLKI